MQNKDIFKEKATIGSKYEDSSESLWKNEIYSLFLCKNFGNYIYNDLQMPSPKTTC